MADSPPAGAYPVGYYPDLLGGRVASAGVFLADAIDPSTGEYRSISRGVDPVEAAAIEALMVHRRTGSAVRDDGMNYADLKFIDDAFESTLKSEIVHAWKRLIDSRQIEFKSLTIEVEDSSAVAKIVFRNLAQERDVPISLPLLKLQGVL